jgi:hypothetical protein
LENEIAHERVIELIIVCQLLFGDYVRQFQIFFGTLFYTINNCF